MAKEYICLVYPRLTDPLMGVGVDLEQRLESMLDLWPTLRKDYLIEADGLSTENGVTLEFILKSESEADAAMLALTLANEVVEVIEQTANIRFRPIEEPSIVVRLRVRATAGGGL